MRPDGIFQHRYRSGPAGSVRARLFSGGETSIPFSLTPVPDQFFNPFGSETKINPVRKTKARAVRTSP